MGLISDGEYLEVAGDDRSSQRTDDPHHPLEREITMIPDEVFQRTLLTFLAPVGEFLDDASISEIMINGPDEVYIERAGRLHLTEARFSSEQALSSAVRNIAQYAGKTVGPDRPVLDARLPDGSRVCVVMPPAARRGISIAIRRLPKERLTVEQLVRSAAASARRRGVPRALRPARAQPRRRRWHRFGQDVAAQRPVGFIPGDERIVVIEESTELSCRRRTPSTSRPARPTRRGAARSPLRELLRATLRLRPDRVVVGECRGGETLDLIQAMTSGHGGALSAVHATYPHDTLNRLESLCLLADAHLPLAALRSQVASAVNIVVQTARMNDGSRRVTHVAECVGLDASGGYELRMLFELRHAGVDPESGRVLGELEATGEVPSFHAEVAARGLTLPPEMGEP